jgi:hypothetical protein
MMNAAGMVNKSANHCAGCMHFVAFVLAFAQTDVISAQDTVSTQINFMQDWYGCKHVQTDNEILFACPSNE